MTKKINKKILIFIMALSLGIIFGIAFTAKFNLSSKSVAELKGAGILQKEASNGKGVSETNFANVFVKVSEEVGPAVVSISSERTQKISPQRLYFGTPKGGGPFNNDEFFNKFFKDFFGEVPETEQKEIGLGSGVIIDKDGFILTNEHVISGADKITVTLSDGRKFQGELKGSDTRSDLAVIKINASGLPYAELGDSDLVRTGEWVTAIGNPFGFMMSTPEPTITVGVVSALHRSLPVSVGKDRGYFDLIQTDAAINPGNSGGPLCNMEGKIIGINVAIYSTTGGYQGVGFAIPVNFAKNIIQDLIKGKPIKYGWLGVTVQPIDQDLADYFGIGINEGVLVSAVIVDGPAHKAGLKAGDVIVSLNKEKIKNTRDILQKVGQAKVGEKVAIGIIRDKKPMELEAIVGERPAQLEEGKLAITDVMPGEATFRGIKVINITPDVRRSLNLKEQEEGVVIKEIASDSPAVDANLRAGDVIKEINKISIKNTDDFAKVTKDLKGNVLIKTANAYIVLKEPEAKK